MQPKNKIFCNELFQEKTICYFLIICTISILLKVSNAHSKFLTPNITCILHFINLWSCSTLLLKCFIVNKACISTYYLLKTLQFTKFNTFHFLYHDQIKFTLLTIRVNNGLDYG